MTNNPPQTDVKAQQTRKSRVAIPVTYLFNAYP